ncbi:MAG: Pr6Pr family membrane protein [Pseudobutyrivibrio sp.]|nr:Pr6Pr family membrane protein [Pseudobutyrivibrio sp.]
MKTISGIQKLSTIFLKIVVSLSAIIGTFLSAYAGRHSFMGGSRVFMYFTIQSNIAIAIICLVGLYYIIRDSEISHVWQIVKFVGTVAITLTGVVFCFVLAPTMGSSAWNIQNILTHVIVPIGAVIDFFLISNCIDLKKSAVLYVIIPPLLYAIYAGVGYVLGWQFADGINYPYFFLNWGSEAGAIGFSSELPFMGTLWWILALLIFLILIGLLYLKISELVNNIFNNRR